MQEAVLDMHLLEKDEQLEGSQSSLGFLPNGSDLSIDLLSSGVHFGVVEVREYERIVGDNPSCSSGAPIGIGWHHIPKHSISVDEFEEQRPPHRPAQEYSLSAYQREHLLFQWGHPFAEIEFAARRLRNLKRIHNNNNKFSSSNNHKKRLSKLGSSLGRVLRKGLRASRSNSSSGGGNSSGANTASLERALQLDRLCKIDESPLLDRWGVTNTTTTTPQTTATRRLLGGARLLTTNHGGGGSTGQNLNDKAMAAATTSTNNSNKKSPQSKPPTRPVRPRSPHLSPQRRVVTLPAPRRLAQHLKYHESELSEESAELDPFPAHDSLHFRAGADGDFGDAPSHLFLDIHSSGSSNSSFAQIDSNVYRHEEMDSFRSVSSSLSSVFGSSDNNLRSSASGVRRM